MALSKGEVDRTYTVSAVKTPHRDMRDFLFTLGCYPGTEVTIISKLKGSYIVNIKDARYSIDTELAEAIFV